MALTIMLREIRMLHRSDSNLQTTFFKFFSKKTGPAVTDPELTYEN